MDVENHEDLTLFIEIAHVMELDVERVIIKVELE